MDISQWLPTTVSAGLLGLVYWYLRSSVNELKSDFIRRTDEAKEGVNLVSKRLDVDEREYLTRETHELICSGQQQSVKLHINEVMKAQREDLDRKLAELYKRIDELKEMIKNGNK